MQSQISMNALVFYFAAFGMACGGEIRHKVEKMEKMFMSRKSGTDLTPEATGYIYRSDNNGPASYVQLGANVVNRHLDASAYPAPLLYYPPVASAPYLYTNIKPAAPLFAANPAPQPQPQQSEEKRDDDDDDDSSSQNDTDFQSDDDSDVTYDDFDGGLTADFIKGIDGGYAGDNAYNNGGGHKYGAADADDHAYSNGGGHKYGAADFSANGEKGDKGYKSHHAFDKGEKGDHEAEGHKGHYSAGGQHASGHHDDAGHYAQHHSSAKGHKGGDFAEKKGHNKGQKTTGYHKVLHKDEYKKEHKFYDDAHNSGHYNKHGAEGANHASSAGEYAKGGRHDSAYHGDNYGKKGFNEQGQYHNNDAGHSAKEGAQSHHNIHQDFAKKGGSDHDQSYGYAVHH